MYKKVLQNLMSDVDDIKEKIDDETYLKLTSGLQKLFKEKENKLYELSFITTKFRRLDTNVYNATPNKSNQIIRLSDDEYTELKKELTKTKSFSKCCCNEVLQGIAERLLTTNTELVGQFMGSDTEDQPFENGMEIMILPRVVILSCKKA